MRKLWLLKVRGYGCFETIGYNIYHFDFTPYEQTFQILSKDTFPPINSTIIFLFYFILFLLVFKFYKIRNNSKYLEQQLHSHRII